MIYTIFQVTGRCNLNCEYCSQQKNVSELSTNEIREVFEKLKKLGVRFLTITGGEPTLRGDLEEICKLVSPFIVTLNSNGVVRQDISTLPNINTYSISLDTFNPTHFDCIVGESGFHKRVTQTIDRLNKNGRKIVINCVVTENNIEHLTPFVKLATRMWNCKVNLQPIIPSLMLELNRVMDVYSGISWRHLHNSSPFIGESKKYLHTGQGFSGCKAGIRFFDILPNGEVWGCSDRKLPFKANILDADFEDKINDHKQDILEHNKKCGGCMYDCYYSFSRCYNPLLIIESIKHLPSMVRQLKCG